MDKLFVMELYLQSLGWWNFLGSVMLLGCLNENFGKKMFNEWTKIIVTEFKLDYWAKLWMVWAIGLNIFYGLVNILAAHWGMKALMQFTVISDLVAYSLFLFLLLWGKNTGRVGDGFWATFVIFSGWLGWGVYVLCI